MNVSRATPARNLMVVTATFPTKHNVTAMVSICSIWLNMRSLRRSLRHACARHLNEPGCLEFCRIWVVAWRRTIQVCENGAKTEAEAEKGARLSVAKKAAVVAVTQASAPDRCCRGHVKERKGCFDTRSHLSCVVARLCLSCGGMRRQAGV